MTRIAPQRKQGTKDWKWKPSLAINVFRAIVHGPASTNVGGDLGTSLTKSLERGAEGFSCLDFYSKGRGSGDEVVASHGAHAQPGMRDGVFH